MAEEFVIGNQQTSEGGVPEISDPSLLAIQQIADNLPALLALSAAIGGTFNPSLVDGNITEIRLRSDTVENLTADNPVIADRELVYAKGGATVDIRIGDGTTNWLDLPNVFVNVEFTLEQLNDAVELAATSATDADEARVATVTLRDEASDFKDDAEAGAAAAAAAANGLPGSLPGGLDPASVSAAKAGSIAQASRKILRVAGVGTASENYDAGWLYKLRRVAPSTAIQITLYPNTFQDQEDGEAWGCVRLEGSGSVQFIAAAGGSNLQTPTIKAQGHFAYRATAAEFLATPITKTFTIPVPAITTGKLVLAVTQITNTSTTSAIACTLDNGLTADTLKAAKAALSVQIPNQAWFTADLNGFSAADVVASIAAGIYLYELNVEWWVLEGVALADNGLCDVKSAGTAGTTVSGALIPSCPAASIILASAVGRGGSDSIAPSGLSSNLTVVASGNTDGEDDPAIANENDQRNAAWLRGRGIATATADFSANAVFSTALGKPTLGIASFSPITVPGAGTVTLHKEGGRATLTELNSVASLHFDANGQDIYISIGAPA